MKKRKLNYRFHNPNSVEATADYLLKVLMEANKKKVEEAIAEAAKNVCDSSELSQKGLSA